MAFSIQSWQIEMLSTIHLAATILIEAHLQTSNVPSYQQANWQPKVAASFLAQVVEPWLMPDRRWRFNTSESTLHWKAPKPQVRMCSQK